MSVLKRQDGVTPVRSSADDGGDAGSPVELRASVRFPVRMKVQVRAADGWEEAETVNVSANGLLFAFSRVLEPGSAVDVEMLMPARALGTPQDVRVHCHCRVIRSYKKGPTLVEVATVIDNYEMVS